MMDVITCARMSVVPVYWRRHPGFTNIGLQLDNSLQQGGKYVWTAESSVEEDMKDDQLTLQG